MPPYAAKDSMFIEPPTNEMLFKQNNSNATIFSLEEWFAEPLSLCHLGWQICAPGYSVGPAIRDLYLIHYVWSGGGVLSTVDGTFAVRQDF